MNKPRYATLLELWNAIQEKREDPKLLTMFLDAGEVTIVSSSIEEVDDLFVGSANETLFTLASLFLGISCEQV